MRDVQEFHASFYKNNNKRDQDIFILKHCESQKPKRNRKRKETGNKAKTLILRYTVKRRDSLVVPVCRRAFQDILGVKKDRILNIMKKYQKNSVLPTENRGGDRIGHKNDNKRQAIKKFVESLKCTESHYCRSKTFNRIYLPAELSINKLWKLYNDCMDNNEELKVKECFFRDYFNKNFNIGFGTPKTDLCSTCLQYKTNIKQHALGTAERENFEAQQKLHKLRANAFYQILQEERDDLVTFSFDCQKNLALPKLPDQSAYFSMQIIFFHLAIICGSSRSSLNSENVRSFVWTELEYQRSSNQVASALHFTLKNFEFGKEVATVRLCCDGCGAQNKNSTVVGMLNYWLQFEAPPQIKKIEIVYPVVGHSYIPPDRLFGKIERIYKKTTVVINPNEYIAMVKKFATVYRVGFEVPVNDWRSETQKVFKQPGYWHFKFQPSKRIIIIKGNGGSPLVRGEAFYRNNLCIPKSLCKRGKHVTQIELRPLVAGVPINNDKKRSIEKLLEKHYGENWEQNDSLDYFKDIFQNVLETNSVLAEENQCENIEFSI